MKGGMKDIEVYYQLYHGKQITIFCNVNYVEEYILTDWKPNIHPKKYGMPAKDPVVWN